jgi:hypothetical protein
MTVLQQRVGHGLSVSWAEFAAQAPELAEFGARRFAVVPAYLATVDDAGAPRVHPVTPIVGDGRLFLFMEPTSPRATTLFAAACTRCTASYPTRTAREASSTSEAAANRSTRRR